MAEEPIAFATLAEKDALKTDVESGGHQYILDEPESEGGTDMGPAPVKAALGALASCTSMTVKLYIQHKGWDVGDIRTDVYYDIKLIKDKDALSEEEQQFVVNSRLRKIHKIVRVAGDFDEAQLKRIRIISGKCPVNLLMIGSCMITDEVALMNS
jgi:putative redox protein